MRCAFSPSSLRRVSRDASTPGNSSWPASQSDEGAPERRPSETKANGGLGACSRGCAPTSAGSRRRGGRRGVLELLLGPEQRVEDLLAETLAQRERETRAHETYDQAGRPAALLALGRRPQRVGRVAATWPPPRGRAAPSCPPGPSAGPCRSHASVGLARDSKAVRRSSRRSESSTSAERTGCCGRLFQPPPLRLRPSRPSSWLP